MSSTTIVPINQSNATFNCPPYTTPGEVWGPASTDAEKGLGNSVAYRMDTLGNDCYMEYSFTATGVWVNLLGNNDHGVYSCQIDDGPRQWFTTWVGSPEYRRGCIASGLSNDKHTLRVANAPWSGWWLTIQNITLTTGDVFTGNKNVTSDWPPYQLPQILEANCTSTTSSSTVTTVTTVTATASSSGNHVSTAAFASVTVILGTLFIGATIAAVYFWARESRFRRDHQWREMISAEPGVPYTTEPATPANISGHSSLTPPPQPPSMADQYPPSYRVTVASSPFGASKAQ